MNFLAHLHLASLAGSSLPGNLMADFIRGNPSDDWPADLTAGIFMHRRIDAMTDGLPQVHTARTWFRPQTRRVSPISLDVMWDHFLSRHWARFSPDEPLTQFVARAEAAIAPILPMAPERFINLNHYLWTERWLERYADMDFIARVLNGMASRRPKLAALRDSWHDLDEHYDALEQLFNDFYPQMMQLAKAQRL